MGWAIDLTPGDVTAPPPNLKFVQFFHVDSTRGDRFIDGQRQAGNPRLGVSQNMIRAGTALTVSGLPAVTYIQTGQAEMHPGGSLGAIPNDNGMTDTSLMFAFWPLADRDAERYFGMAAYLALPTGSYDHRRAPFNIGEHRYRYALQAGYQQRITGNWHAMAAFDAVWSSDNAAFGAARARLSQDPLYTGQVAMHYNLDKQHLVGLSYFHTYGGATQLNGIDRNDRTRQRRWMLTASGLYDIGRLSLQYGSDIETDNGQLENRRWTLRYTRYF